ncbi:hypothetical protein BDP81DRAFT_44665 [Colletotrichum phormii]|uniref:Uncharacterized protein n=1 Tax=Colletotrichum phormii TaxID=359342 RepID=A0AAI9ZQX3_9PEZI|nr:uncharacterized protein BDP81DRAFT_44665 [Colletotrichum phormii]KAK1635057.1 hypothetical protein BDP81DRAFT_44665 [Colletotrichum phormii]
MSTPYGVQQASNDHESRVKTTAAVSGTLLLAGSDRGRQKNKARGTQLCVRIGYGSTGIDAATVDGAHVESWHEWQRMAMNGHRAYRAQGFGLLPTACDCSRKSLLQCWPSVGGQGCRRILFVRVCVS